MLHNWFLMLPEICFICYLLVACLIKKLHTTQTAKTYFTLSKNFLLVILAATLVFYNKSPAEQWFQNTSYTTLFKIVIYLVALAWFYLSSKWFLFKNRPSFAFYTLAMSGLLLLELLISARSFICVGILIPLLCLQSWRILHLYRDEEDVGAISRLYAFFACVFCLMLWGGTALLYAEINSLYYADVYNYLQQNQQWRVMMYVAVSLMLAPLLFMLGLAPFHSCFVGMVKNAVLPVSGFFTLIPPLAYLACLITAMINIFYGTLDFFRPVLMAFAVISLLIGALSANGEKNLRQLFAFSTVYHLGFLIFTIVSFNDNSILSAFVYMTLYILAMSGVYTVFLGLKSRGLYLSSLDDIAGLSVPKPYISASMLVFMFSLIGIPPMLGFLGRLSAINNLVLEERWSDVCFLLISMLFMVNAYLQVIRMVYFETPRKPFDRTDKAIYICLFINLVLVVISILNPSFLLQDAERVLNGIF